MKLLIDIAGEQHTLEMRGNEFVFDDKPGAASIEQVKPGVYSVLIGFKSFRIHVSLQGEAYEVVTSDGVSQRLTIIDPRDQVQHASTPIAKGPMTVRAQMPGKVIKHLVQVGTAVESGQGLLVVEAMKMQNEVKAPKTGVVTKILAAEEATVTAGEGLLVVD